MSALYARILPYIERKQNDSKWIYLQGWRFIHHPKVKKDRNNQRDYS